MKEKIQALLKQMIMLSGVEEEFKLFNSTLPTDVCDADYISSYSRSQYADHLKDAKQHLWEIIGAVSKYDFNTFLPIAVEYITDGNVVLEREEETEERKEADDE